MSDPTTYLVTGVAGNLGSSVAARLLADGHRVRGLVLPGDPAAARVPAAVEVHLGDVTDSASLEPFFAGVPGENLVVIHCAAIVTVNAEYSQKLYDVNLGGTGHVVDACVAHGVRKLVHVSSTGAIPDAPHGTPITEPDHFDPELVVGHYGKSKALASQLVLDAVRARGLDATLVFPTGIFGPDDYAYGPVASFVMEFAAGQMTMGVEGSFNAVDVRDLADAIVEACDRGRTGEGYILGNECVSMRAMLDLLSDLTGRPRVKRIVPAAGAKLMGWASDRMQSITGKPARMSSFAVYNLTRNNLFDSSKARRELSFTTRPFADSMRDTVAWLDADGKLAAAA